jgi:hypothetical protein
MRFETEAKSFFASLCTVRFPYIYMGSKILKKIFFGARSAYSLYINFFYDPARLVSRQY